MRIKWKTHTCSSAESILTIYDLSYICYIQITLLHIPLSEMASNTHECFVCGMFPPHLPHDDRAAMVAPPLEPIRIPPQQQHRNGPQPPALPMPQPRSHAHIATPSLPRVTTPDFNVPAQVTTPCSDTTPLTGSAQIPTPLAGPAQIPTPLTGSAQIPTPLTGPAQIPTPLTGPAQIPTLLTGPARIPPSDVLAQIPTGFVSGRVPPPQRREKEVTASPSLPKRQQIQAKRPEGVG